MTDARLLALGCMRLSTDPDRDETAAIAVLHAALDAGVTLLDTAHAGYAQRLGLTYRPAREFFDDQAE